MWDMCLVSQDFFEFFFEVILANDVVHKLIIALFFSFLAHYISQSSTKELCVMSLMTNE